MKICIRQSLSLTRRRRYFLFDLRLFYWTFDVWCLCVNFRPVVCPLSTYWILFPQSVVFQNLFLNFVLVLQFYQQKNYNDFVNWKRFQSLVAILCLFGFKLRTSNRLKFISHYNYRCIYSFFLLADYNLTNIKQMIELIEFK